MRKKASLVILASFSAALAFYFLFFSGDDPELDEHAGHDHAAHATEEHDHEAEPPIHGEPRLSKLLRDPQYQEPSENPLVGILSQETLLTGPYMAPRFAADGKHVLLAGENYHGLWVALRDGSGLRQISDEYMAGWRPVTTPEGDLVYRTAQVDDQGVVVGFTIKRHNLETGEEEIVYQGVNEDVYPPWLSQDGDMLFIRRDGEVIAEPLTAAAASIPLSERDEGFAYSDGGQVFYHHVGLNETMPLSTDPEATGGEAVSPDGRHAAYLSGNTDSVLIVDLQTGKETDIGEGSDLSWSPDGKLLLYQVSGDDGHRILESHLYVASSDGETIERLTYDPNMIIGNPSWSPEGDRIIASTEKGEILLFHLSK